jgi:hypothetical protein
MAKYKHAYVIPDGAKIKGGTLYDRWGNLTHFADVAALEDLANTAADKETAVQKHSRPKFMNSKGKVSVSATTRYYSVGLRQSKGALPGFNLTLSDGTELRTFTYDGNISGFVAWLKTKAKVDIDMFGPTGTPYDPIPAAEGGL